VRICYRPGCDAAADVWYKGAWCAAHADQQYGAVIGTLSAINVPAAAHRHRDAAPATAPVGTHPSDGVPSSGGGPGVPVDNGADPLPLSEAELFAIFEADYWQDAADV
jgi:hypothetical protein